jgi:UPF0755 protein
MKMATGTLIVVLIVMIGLGTAATALWGRYLAQPGPLQAPVHVVINPGEGPHAMSRKLAEARVISHPQAFVWAVRAMRLAHTLKAGEYAFDPGISLRAVVNKLALGDAENRSVTIPEGWTVRQVLERLRATEGLTGVAVSPAEGMVFPDTYAFRFGTERGKLLDSMAERMREELAKAWAARDQTLPLNTPEELLALASIVQKEAASDAEMPMVAAVFVNRLRSGMKLQSDPTVQYGADMTDTRLRKKDLTEPHPFNTYVYPGLPPTPIANPGRAALQAAARPASTPALFFVADPSRTMHVFSDTYAAHEKAVQRYWKAMAKLPARSVSASVAVTPSAVVTSATTPHSNQRK